MHYLGDEGPQMLTRLLNALEKSTVITTLYMGSNDLEDAGINIFILSLI